MIADMVADLASEIAASGRDDARYAAPKNDLSLMIVYLTLALLSAREEFGALAVRLVRAGEGSIAVRLRSQSVEATFKNHEFERVVRYPLSDRTATHQ